MLELDDGTLSTGWNTKADGSGTSYQAGDKINLNENTTLYAQWPAAQKIMDTAAAVEAIGKMEQGKKLELTLGGEIDLSQLKDALTQAKGTVSLDLSQAEGLTTIGAGAFQGITALTSVTLPDEVTSIGANAFAGSGLTSITLQEGLLSIGDNAFKGTKLSAIQLPQTLTTIGSGAFSETTNLTSNVSIPASVTEIKANAFAGSGLTSITLESSAANITIDNTAIPSGAGIAVPPTELEAYTQKFPTYRSQFTGFVQYRVSYLFETTDGNYVPATSAGVSDSNGIYQDKQVSGIPGQQTSETAPAAPTGFMDGQVVQQVLADDGSTVVEVKYERKTVTITINSITGAGTSGLVSPFTGKYGAATNISPTPPANFTFVKWVDNNGSDVTIPTTFPLENQTIEAANALYTNAAGHPVYPAYLTVQRTSYSEATDSTTSTASTKGVGKMTGVGGKTYSQQIANHPKDDGYMTSAGNGYGLAGGMGSYRIPALVELDWNGGTRIFAAFDVRYRGQTNGGGDVGDTSTNGNDVLIMYSDDGGATWPGKYLIDVKNSYGKNATLENSTAIDTDIGDPQLFVSGSNVYMIAAGGGGILGAKRNSIPCNTRIWKSADGGVSWQEITTSAEQSFAFRWDTLSPSGVWNLGGPGHGIVLKKAVPFLNGGGTSNQLVEGTTVLPMQGGDGSSHGVYLVAGTGEPSASWTAVNNSKSPTNEEGQVCQLDDGTLLLAMKQDNKTTMKRFAAEGVYTLGSETWTSGGASQMSLLKVKDGDGSSNYGVVALCNPRTGGANGSGDDDTDTGRGNVIVSFARDKTGRESVGTNTSPLGDERYYINIRAEKQRYFGYSDMVMVNDEMLGLLYECCHRTEENVDGMRFITIDVSEILQRLSYSN